MEIVVPDYAGGSLVNLMAELEFRLSGVSASKRLSEHLAVGIPDAETYVLVMFDGLGAHQLSHPNIRHLAASLTSPIDAPFPYTTTVSMSTVATGLPPSQHGIIAYQLWMEEVGEVVNTIHMRSQKGNAVDLSYNTILPGPNLWERLATNGCEPISIQPENFDRTPLTRTLYRGTQFRPYWSEDEAVDLTVEAATGAGRLVFLYLPHVDFAAHAAGQESTEYDDALQTVDNLWQSLSARLPSTVTLIGTADHGHVDIAEDHKIRLDPHAGRARVLYGGARAMFIKGDGETLAHGIPATWIPAEDLPDLWGSGPVHPSFAQRQPDGILFPDDGYAVFHKHANDRLVGYHGGLMPAEREVPLLVRGAV